MKLGKHWAGGKYTKWQIGNLVAKSGSNFVTNY